MKHLIIALAILFIAGCGTNENEEELLGVAEDTYAFFESHTDPDTGLTADRIDLDLEGAWEEAGHTSPTNIAMYLLSVVSAVEMDILTEEEGFETVQVTLNSLEEMETWNGLYYNWYFIDSGELMTDWGQFISMVDNGWLTASLVILGQYFDDLAPQTQALVEAMDYSPL